MELRRAPHRRGIVEDLVGDTAGGTVGGTTGTVARALAVALTIACGLPAAAAGIRNGSFESHGGWLIHSSGGLGRRGAPAIEEDQGVGGSRALRIGRPLTGPATSGVAGAEVAQAFACDAGGSHCVVTFRARFVARDGEVAVVRMAPEQEPTRLPFGELEGSPAGFEDYAFSSDGCTSETWVSFSIQEPVPFPGDPEPEPGIQSTLIVDDVASECASSPRYDLGVGGGEPPDIPVAVCFGAPCVPRVELGDWWSSPPVPFLRGDADGDGSAKITDAIAILLFLFQGGLAPRCLDSADTNDNGGVEITDAVYLLNHLFLGGSPPDAPFPDCGSDPTPDALSCDDSGCV